MPSSNFRPSIHLALGALALAGAAAPLASAQNECSTAIAITAGEPTAFSTGAATASANPPSDALCPGTALDWADSPDVWFRWIAPRDSLATISTCGTNSYDTSIAFYRGTCAAPTLIACNGDASANANCQPGFSRIDNVFVEQGVEYFIRIGGRNGQAGLGTVQLDFEQPPDGVLDARYPIVLAVQNTQTAFGDSNPGTVDYANGSELNTAYATIANGALHVFLGGNLESNYNKVELFLDWASGGQQRLRGNNVDIDFNGLNRMGDDPATTDVEGLKFDEGFAPDLYFTATGGGQPYAWYLNFATLPTDGAGVGAYLGTGGAGAEGGRILGPAGSIAAGFGFGIDNSNVTGVDGGCDVSTGAGVATGLEIRIPLAVLAGYDGGQIRLCAFINAGGHDYASNQFLAGLGGACNLAEPRAVDLSTIPGDQFFVFDPACTVDSDNDGTLDCNDGCPNDPAKIAPGLCGCGVADTDSDSDGTPDCNDGCPSDPMKIAPGQCGCGVADIDTDGDGAADCNDACPSDPAKIEPGQCGCGVADTDTDGDGLADCIDNCDTVANPDQRDCNSNGIGDACELASGALADCDADGIPNVCEGAQLVAIDSGLLAPFGSGQPATYEFTSLVPAFVTAPRLTIEATSDLNSSSEFIAVSLDGGSPTYIFVADGSDCPTTPDVWSRTFTAAEFAALAADGVLEVELVASGTVSATQCADGGVRVKLAYEALPTNADCNGNGVLDSCEAATGAVADCNDDDIPDTCQISAGTWADCNANGVLDVCELIAGTAEDCDRDGLLDPCALAAGAPDCNGNGVIDRCEGGFAAASLGSVGFSYNRYDAPLVKVSAGLAHYSGIDANGNVVSWGYDYGITRVPQGLINATRIAAGGFHSAAVMAGGKVVCWGINDAGQCNVPYGLPPAIDVAVSRLYYSTSINYSALLHTMALLESGTVACWGSNSQGQCAVPPGITDAVGIAAGGQFSLALRSNGTIAAWGYGVSGQTNPPTSAGAAASIAAGDSHALGLRTDGTVFAWGRNNEGQANVPSDLANVVKIAAGGRHSVALRSDGSIACWGSNQNGQTSGNNQVGPFIDVDAGDIYTVGLSPTGRTTTWGTDYLFSFASPVPAARIVQIAIGSATESNNYSLPHFVALRDDGTVACWGSNRHGESIPPAGLVDVVAVAASGNLYALSSTAGGHSMALTRSGQVVCWGLNNFGQCNVPAGLKPVIAISTPSTISGNPPVHCLALQIDGRVVAWGSNGSGQCNVPTDLGQARAIAAGSRFSLAALVDGTVRKWGSAGASPPELTNVVRVAAGFSHGVALRSDGTVAVWGAAAPPAGLNDVRAIAAGASVSYALRPDGSVVRWGSTTATGITSDASLVAMGPYNSIAAAGIQLAAVRSSDIDCDGNGVPDECDIAAGGFADCNGNGLIDACEIRIGSASDCNANGVPDSCDIAAGIAQDCDVNGRPDSCDLASTPARDCNANGTLDACEIASGAAADCDANGRIDSCDIATNPTRDCDNNGLLDSCEIAAGTIADCNGNGRIDACDAATGSLTAWGTSTALMVAAIPPELGPVGRIDAGTSHLVVQRTDGTLRAVGLNTSGQLNVPTTLGPVTSFSAAGNHSIAIDLSGTVHCWGSNTSGQCNVPADLGPATKVAAGGNFSVALAASGSLRAWGANTFGQLNAPSNLVGISAIACGVQHGLAIHQGGQVRGWGWNQNGQASPPATTITAVAGGSVHSIGLRADGSVVCWGTGFATTGALQFGQCIVPSTLGPCVAIDAGGFNSIALQADGTVVRWGQLTTTSLNPPQALGTAQLIAAASNAFIAYRAPTPDCDDDGVIDSCASAEPPADCNANQIPDTCEIASGLSTDLDANGIPDECGDLVVGGTGYDTIPEAIAAAADGATIVVGNIVHGPFTISGRTITLRAASGAVPTIDGALGARCVTVDGDATDRVVIDGFRFINGRADVGGALLATGLSIDLLRCTFEDNDASIEAGAVAIESAVATASDCIFRRNTAPSAGVASAREGGGMSLLRCTASDNGSTIEASALLLAVPSSLLDSRFEINGDNAADTIITIASGGALSMGGTGFCRNASQSIGGAYTDLGDNWFSGDCDSDGFCDHDEAELLASGLVEWRVADGGNGHRYLVIDQLLSWEAAQLFATSLGGHLATATSAAENAFVAAQAGSRSCWIGGLQDEATGEPDLAWRWVTGEPWNFTAWYPGEPNDVSGGEDRLMIFAGQWTDLGCPGQCDYRLPSIIEFSDATYIRSLDCNDNDILDGCELDAGTASDCNGNGVIDSCDIASGSTIDCNANGIPDTCDLAGGAADCNANGVIDSCDIAGGAVDCNANGIPDTCDLTGGAADCNANGVIDSCDIAGGAADCNANGVIDSCDIAGGAADCDANGVLDSCQLASGASTDLDANGVLDECAGESVVGGSGFSSIQAALDALPANATIRVAAGTWAPFDLSGFAGSISSFAGSATTIIDGGGTQRCITRTGAADGAASVHGFTVTNGFAIDGGAAFVEGSRLDFTHCDFLNNEATDRGGAVCVIGTEVGLTSCVFDGNVAGRGGAVFLGASQSSARSLVSLCVFDLNSAGFVGGALRVEGKVDIFNCSVEANSAGESGGGASFAVNSGVTITNSRFCRNNPDNTDGPFEDDGGNSFSVDCDADGICDDNEIAVDPALDCDLDGALDACELAANPTLDCNNNGVLDSCDIGSGTSNDVDANGIPDECKPDCDGDGLPDAYQIAQNPALDCDLDGTLDSCEITANPALDCDLDGTLDACEIAANPALDCDLDGALDACEIAANPAIDCDLDGALDVCELGSDPSLDCNGNGRLDACDVASGAEDKNGNAVPDTCEFAVGDFDLDGIVGAADLAVLLSFWGFPSPPIGDLDGNGVVGGGDLSVLLSNWGPTDW